MGFLYNFLLFFSSSLPPAAFFLPSTFHFHAFIVLAVLCFSFFFSLLFPEKKQQKIFLLKSCEQQKKKKRKKIQKFLISIACISFTLLHHEFIYFKAQAEAKASFCIIFIFLFFFIFSFLLFEDVQGFSSIQQEIPCLFQITFCHPCSVKRFHYITQILFFLHHRVKHTIVDNYFDFCANSNKKSKKAKKKKNNTREKSFALCKSFFFRNINFIFHSIA